MTNKFYNYESWTIYNKYHRDNSPAISFQDGSKEWYYNGKYMRFEWHMAMKK